MVNEIPQAQMPGEDGRQEPINIDHQAVIVEGDLDPDGVVAWGHLSSAHYLAIGSCCKTGIPETQKHLLV